VIRSLSASQHYLAAINGLGTLGAYHVSDPLRLIFVDVPERIFQGFWYTSGADNQFRWPWFACLLFWLVLFVYVGGLWRYTGIGDARPQATKLGVAPRGLRTRRPASAVEPASPVSAVTNEPSITPDQTRRNIALLAALVALSLLCVWMVAFSTATYEARLAFGGLPALACLAALGVERWRLPHRFTLPLLGFSGAAVAIVSNVLTVSWHR
jgi:hypothetical protein